MDDEQLRKRCKIRTDVVNVLLRKRRWSIFDLWAEIHQRAADAGYTGIWSRVGSYSRLAALIRSHRASSVHACWHDAYQIADVLSVAPDEIAVPEPEPDHGEKGGERHAA